MCREDVSSAKPCILDYAMSLLIRAEKEFDKLQAEGKAGKFEGDLFWVSQLFISSDAPR